MAISHGNKRIEFKLESILRLEDLRVIVDTTRDVEPTAVVNFFAGSQRGDGPVLTISEDLELPHD